MLTYRDRIKREYPNEAVRSTMVLKWDLFVPFVAASLNLLKQESEHGKAGKMAIITSNAIETMPYCEGLRELLVTRATVDELHFFPGVKLFEDAMVQNTITVAANRQPTGHTHTERFWHAAAPKWGSLAHASSQNLRQSHYKTGVFRPELPTLALAQNVNAVPLGDVFYISKGMVLNADEKTNKGAFKMDDLISDTTNSVHSAAFAGSKDVDFFGINNVRYIEYGPSTRVPAKLSRPTFPELYDRPKLMVAEFGGFAYDDGTWDDAGFLKCNHSVFLLMRWCHLAGVDNKSIRNQLDHRAPIRETLETESAKIDPWYVLAFLNSQQMRALLDGVNRSAIAGRLQPDDLRQISIPIPDDPAVMAAIAHLAQRASGIQKLLLPLRNGGWKIDSNMAQAPAHIPANIPALALDCARVKWGLHISAPAAKVHKLIRSGHRLLSGKQEVALIAAFAPELAIEWLRRQLLTLPEGTTLGEVEQMKPMIPETPELAKKALELLIQEEQRAIGLLAEIKQTRQEISEQLETLFEQINHPPIKSGKLAA